MRHHGPVSKGWVMDGTPWGKLEPGEASPEGRRWLSLVDHSADVCAVFAAMLAVPLIAQRLAPLAGVDRWPEPWTARLATHVALHDFGKANRGFQARREPDAPRVGHVLPGLALLYSGGQLPLADALPFEAMANW
jgi:CRISPR-associated endonuclease/helicase Cas3